MACPFFMPKTRFEDGGWLHPSRLPLGAGWRGECCAPGQQGTEPSNEELRELCNLGYATGCLRLPRERNFDAVSLQQAAELSLGGADCRVRHVVDQADDDPLRIGTR